MSAQDFLYRKIADSIRRQIERGQLKPGDRLPSVRQMAARWGCTLGTVQRAYRELAAQRLVFSRPGQGTRLARVLPADPSGPLRRAALVHRAEGFLLEALTAGHSLDETEQAVRMALDRWRAVRSEPQPPTRKVVRFVGSHDPAMDWLAAHFDEIASGYHLQLHFAGSLRGLMALTTGAAELAGCHLWDDETQTYNLPYLRRLLPSRRLALITLAHRRLGLILPPGNPGNVRELRDLTRRGLRFVNRQPGSGTRVWLDAALRKLDLPSTRIRGYTHEEQTHSAVAQAVAEGRADAGLGVETAARAYGLDFVLLTLEPYQLVVPTPALERAPFRALLRWLGSRKARRVLASLGGYETSEAGRVLWVE
ncbi:MAG: substrate-binding domain-containing protein [Chloroflexota bacterium]